RDRGLRGRLRAAPRQRAGRLPDRRRRCDRPRSRGPARSARAARAVAPSAGRALRPAPGVAAAPLGRCAPRARGALPRAADGSRLLLPAPQGRRSAGGRAGVDRGAAPRQPRARGQEGADRRRRHAQHLRAVDRAVRPRHGDGLRGQRPRGRTARARGPEHRHRADGHHDAGDGRARDDAGDPQARPPPGSADHRGHREGDEGRPGEVHRGGRLGLPRQTGRHRASALRVARLGASLMDEKVNILVVDDMPDKLLALRSVLDELDQNLVMVNTGAAALRELLHRDFAVILLDVNMPDIDGIETAELIRQHPKTAHTPIIFVTAYADEMQTARGYALGAVDYILSPIVPEILRSKVRVFVDLYRAQRRSAALARADALRAAAEEATRRSQFLDWASRELGASLDLETGMRRLLEMLVPARG